MDSDILTSVFLCSLSFLVCLSDVLLSLSLPSYCLYLLSVSSWSVCPSLLVSLSLSLSFSLPFLLPVNIKNSPISSSFLSCGLLCSLSWKVTKNPLHPFKMCIYDILPGIQNHGCKAARNNMDIIPIITPRFLPHGWDSLRNHNAVFLGQLPEDRNIHRSNELAAKDDCPWRPQHSAANVISTCHYGSKDLYHIMPSLSIYIHIKLISRRGGGCYITDGLWRFDWNKIHLD